MTNRSALRLEDLTVEFPGTAAPAAVRGLGFDLAPGRTLGIVGESGSGKSVTLRAVMGILPGRARITSGALWIGDTQLPLVGKQLRAARRRRLAMVFQDSLSALNPVMRVGDLIAEVPRRVLGEPAAQARRTAIDLMRQVRLPDPERLARAYPHQLSGGQRQRVAIAAALAGRPEVLLCDEPTTALDVTVQSAVLDLLNEIKERTNLTTVFVSHDLAVISQVADDVLVMRHGGPLESGPAPVVLGTPRDDYTRQLLAAAVELPPPGGTVAPAGKDGPAADTDRSEPPRLEARCVRVAYRGADRPALAAVDLALRPGRIHGLVGESGSGKTTLARVLTGQLRPDAGTVRLDGVPLTGHRRDRTRLRAVQMVFQDPYASLDPRMTVRQTLVELLRLVGVTGRAATEARCRELLDQVAMPAAALDRVPGQFSGGQRQRIAIARALAVEPTVLVADEPTSALDVSVQSTILQLIARLCDDIGLSVLLISHNLGVVHEICDEVSVIHHGEIVETGPTRRVFADPAHDYTRRLIDSVPRLRKETIR
jgi:ABC-type glutathione transport system ATPase component